MLKTFKMNNVLKIIKTFLKRQYKVLTKKYSLFMKINLKYWTTY